MTRWVVAILAIAVVAAGCGSSSTQHATITDTDGDGVPDSRDAAPNIPSIQTRAEAAAAKKIERGARIQAQQEQAAQKRRERKAERKPDREDAKRERAIGFFTKTDDDAVALDDAIERAFNGDAAARADIERLRRHIRDRINARLLRGEDQSVGANLILSAAADARAAIDAGDQHALVRAREDLRKGRDRLADEIVG